MVEKLLELNSELEGSTHHWSDNLLSTTLLNILAAHLPNVVHVYKTGNIRQSAWSDDFDQVCIKVFSMLEKNDRMEGKNAIDAECWAMRTKTITAGDDVTSLCDELRQLREQMAAMTTIKAAMRTTTNAKPCDKCNVPHRGHTKNFTFISDPARRLAAAAAALKRCQDYQLQKGGGNPKPDKLQRMCAAMTKVVTCYKIALRPAISPGFRRTMDTWCSKWTPIVTSASSTTCVGSHSASPPSPKCWSRQLRRACQPSSLGTKATPLSSSRWRSHRVHQCAAGARHGRQLGFCRAGHGAEQGR
eukprot:4098292-Pleurochrysis_carterae.AAC.1